MLYDAKMVVDTDEDGEFEFSLNEKYTLDVFLVGEGSLTATVDLQARNHEDSTWKSLLEGGPETVSGTGGGSVGFAIENKWGGYRLVVTGLSSDTSLRAAATRRSLV